MISLRLMMNISHICIAPDSVAKVLRDKNLTNYFNFKFLRLCFASVLKSFQKN